MIIRYINEDRKGEQNVTISIPMMVESCCSDCMVWFFKNTLDIVIKDAMLIKMDVSNPKHYEVFSYCQFCGKRHKTELMEK